MKGFSDSRPMCTKTGQGDHFGHDVCSGSRNKSVKYQSGVAARVRVKVEERRE